MTKRTVVTQPCDFCGGECYDRVLWPGLCPTCRKDVRPASPTYGQVIEPEGPVLVCNICHEQCGCGDPAGPFCKCCRETLGVDRDGKKVSNDR